MATNYIYKTNRRSVIYMWFIGLELTLVTFVTLFFEKGQSPDYRLFAAIQQWELEDSKTALETGANPNAMLSPYPGLPREPLLAYAIRARPPLAPLLIEKGADVNVSDSNDVPVLIYAILAQNQRLVELLLQKGADPNALARQARQRASAKPGVSSALMLAVEVGNPTTIKSLLQKGANPNYQIWDTPSFGVSPLMMAAQGRPEVVKMLLEAGANPALKDDNGRTALDIARKFKQKEAIKQLTQWKGAMAKK
jgi:hypothetical protein